MLRSRETYKLNGIVAFLLLLELAIFVRAQTYGAIDFFNVGTPSRVHLFDHLLLFIFQSSITHYIKHFLQVLTCFESKPIVVTMIPWGDHIPDYRPATHSGNYDSRV